MSTVAAKVCMAVWIGLGVGQADVKPIARLSMSGEWGVRDWQSVDEALAVWPGNSFPACVLQHLRERRDKVGLISDQIETQCPEPMPSHDALNAAINADEIASPCLTKGRF